MLKCGDNLGHFIFLLIIHVYVHGMLLISLIYEKDIAINQNHSILTVMMNQKWSFIPMMLIDLKIKLPRLRFSSTDINYKEAL